MERQSMTLRACLTSPAALHKEAHESTYTKSKRSISIIKVFSQKPKDQVRSDSCVSVNMLTPTSKKKRKSEAEVLNYCTFDESPKFLFRVSTLYTLLYTCTY